MVTEHIPRGEDGGCEDDDCCAPTHCDNCGYDTDCTCDLDDDEDDGSLDDLAG